MEALTGENADEYYKSIYYEIQSLMKRDIWDIVSRKSVAGTSMLPITWYFKYKRKPDCTIRKFKA